MAFSISIRVGGVSELFIPLYAFSAIFPVLALVLSFISAIFEAFFCFFSRKVKIIIWNTQSFRGFFLVVYQKMSSFVGVNQIDNE